MKFFTVCTVLTLLCITTSWAQLNLAGIVTDEKGQPLEGAIIIIRGTSKGTLSQANGQFAFRSTESLPITLTVSFIGHYQQNVIVRGNNFRNIIVRLTAEKLLTDQTAVGVSRVPEDIQKAALTVEKLGVQSFQESPSLSPFDALQNVTGVDFLTQSLAFKSVSTRGFGSTNNSRFLQLTDGMDNRSPGLGSGFGNVAGLPDLDIESIELVPGASSALYGPDAMQGLMLTTSKNPFTYQGLSAQVKVGVNNVGKAGFGPKSYTDLSVRYAKELSDRLAVKVSFQHIGATDFIADDYSDRSTSARSSFFLTDASRGGIATGIGYLPNNNANTNFEYDGVNVYGDDVNGGGAFRFPDNYANVLLSKKLVTRNGYTELDVLGNNGKVFNNRANVSLHYKLSGNLEASLGWYYGNGNFIRANNYREYFPDYQRHQIKAELRGKNFFLRAYTTQQNADGWSIGQTATAVNNTWKSLNQWAVEFGQAYVETKVSVGLARTEADRNRYLPGSNSFNTIRDAYANTYNTDFIPGSTTARGRRFRDDSQLWHYEGMYAFKNLFQLADVVAGASWRHYALESVGTLFARQPDGQEYTINELGAYLEASRELALNNLTIKPTVAVRYDKNQYLKGGLTPRFSATVGYGVHHLRASWQTAFHNPTPEQLLAAPIVGAGGQVGGLPVTYNGTGLGSNPGYLQTDAVLYQANPQSVQLPQPYPIDPNRFTTEKLSTWEIGYKTLIKNKLYVDAFYFASSYTDLLTTQTLYQLVTPGTSATALISSTNYRILQVNVNSPNQVYVRGAGVDLEYGLGDGFTLRGNYTHQTGLVTLRDEQGAIRNDLAGAPVVKRKMSNPEVVQLGRNYFNSPENRYTISLSNPRLTDHLGATISYRWTDKMWYEQGITAGDVWLPAWSSLDAQVSYKLPVLKSVIKLGGTNILNQYIAQGYGLAQIGGLYYVSITFDELMR
ncbi:TonB-dependent receptor plug domain-containing protein [Spirosoma sp. KNUC1025]|uniref:TonB-dependent receptor plug domain-containing protein n=1 Tax=Spirosoma sp. KNUC1025 TaxID=2894082 RepID=UPI00386753A0|nr:TonB-dependent receptor [Spirosoma sp. KNUC1025]